jgi:hypothetical protein
MPVEICLVNGDRHLITDPLTIARGRDLILIAYSDSHRIAWFRPDEIASITKLSEN